MYPTSNYPARYNQVPAQPPAITGAQQPATAPVVSFPQWLYQQSISKRSLDALAQKGQAGTTDEQALAQLFQNNLGKGPISLKTPPTLNSPHAVYEANVMVNGAKVTIRASFSVDANHGFELHALGTHDGPSGKYVGIKLPTVPPLPSPNAIASSSQRPQEARTGLNQALINQNRGPAELDHRQNDVGATQRESSWAVKTLENISPAQTKLFLPHIFNLIATTHNYKQAYDTHLRQTPGMTTATHAAQMARFSHADAVKKNINEGVKRREPATELIKRLLDTLDFKQMLDLTGALLELTNPGLHHAIREQPFFTDRGRTMRRQDQVRDSSLFNRHAGIADELHRRPSTENFFKQGIVHAKADFMRAPESSTARQFSKSGVPFIVGASGSMQFILQALEMQKPQAQRTPVERAQVETLLLTHTAVMVAGGHHSIVEALLPGRKLGYFNDLPDPLKGKNGYRDFMQAFDARLAALNMNGGVRLSTN